MKTKIIITDDHTLVSNTIADLINGMEKFEVTHQFKNGQDLVDYLQKASVIPEIILLDINMPKLNGFETMKILTADFPAIKVLALSMNDNENSIIKMMQYGACGFLSKIVKEEDLMHALEEIVEEGYYYTTQVTKLVMNNFQKKSDNQEILLNNKEIELLKYACTEMTYKEIAAKMNLSPKTIDGYRENLFLKLDVKSRIGLVLYAIKNRIASVD